MIPKPSFFKCFAGTLYFHIRQLFDMKVEKIVSLTKKIYFVKTIVYFTFLMEYNNEKIVLESATEFRGISTRICEI